MSCKKRASTVAPPHSPSPLALLYDPPALPALSPVPPLGYQSSMSFQQCVVPSTTSPTTTARIANSLFHPVPHAWPLRRYGTTAHPIAERDARKRGSSQLADYSAMRFSYAVAAGHAGTVAAYSQPTNYLVSAASTRAYVNHGGVHQNLQGGVSFDGGQPYRQPLHRRPDLLTDGASSRSDISTLASQRHSDSDPSVYSLPAQTTDSHNSTCSLWTGSIVPETPLVASTSLQISQLGERVERLPPGDLRDQWTRELYLWACHIDNQDWKIQNEKDPDFQLYEKGHLGGCIQPQTPSSRFDLFFDREGAHRCKWIEENGRCCYSSPRKDQARSHVYSHFSYAPFTCSGRCGIINCPRRFAFRNHCEDHVKRGVDSRSECSECGTKVLKQNISRHMKESCKK